MEHFRIPRLTVSREQFVLDICKDMKVLHLGCASYPYTEERIQSGEWLHEKVIESAANCIGVDLDGKVIHMLQDRYGISNIIEGNAEELDKLDLGQFDIVLAGEIIEHLNNPGRFLESALSVLKPNGKLVITTTNAYCARRFIRIPFGIESIHPDHVYYFSHTVLNTLAKRFGFELLEAYAYKIPNKTPLLPYVFERFATLITPNWGEGIIHVYRMDNI